MIPQIQNRIKQIQRSEIPTGYKKTEIGILPCDWGAALLGDLLDFKNGVNAEKEKYNSGVKMISVMDILSESPIYYDSIRGQVDIDPKALDMYGVTYGDLLFQRSSETFEDAGKSNVYLDRNKTATYSGFVIRGKKKADYEPYYLNETLRISSSRNQIVRNSAGSQHINVGQASLSKVIVPFAPSIEQSKIAEILMKWDAAIELQEKYIEKLETHKKYLFSRLLHTGFKKDSSLQDLIDRGHARLIKPKELPVFEDERLYLSTSSIVKNEIVGNEGYINYFNRPSRAQMYPIANSVWFAKMENSIKVYKFSKEQQERYVLSTGFYGFLCNEKELSSDYLMQVFLSPGFNKMKDLYSEGSSQNGIKDNSLSDIILYLPSIMEQHNISTILLLADNEISLQKEKLEKIKKQRKALQQYLLNGIVRVH